MAELENIYKYHIENKIDIPYPIDLKFTENRIVKEFKYKDILEDKIKLITSNKEYNLCFQILRKFNLENEIHPSTTLVNIARIIEQKYAINIDTNGVEIKVNTDSFIPLHKRFNRGGFYYNTYRTCKYDEYFKTIDHNKSYTSILRGLKILIKCDIRTCEFKLINLVEKDASICDTYLYIARPRMSNVLLQNQNLYTGEHLIYSRNEGIEFVVLEELQTTYCDSYFEDMINDIFINTTESQQKMIINAFIGSFEPSQDRISSFYKYIKAGNEKEINTISSLRRAICPILENDITGDLKESNKSKIDQYLSFEEKARYPDRTRKPIAIQIKDKHRRIVYEEMKQLLFDNNLTKEDIHSVNVDSITLILKKDTVLKNFVNSKSMGGWKILPNYLPKANNNNMDNYLDWEDDQKRTLDYSKYEYDDLFPNSYYDKEQKRWTESVVKKNNNHLYLGDAGSGKTYLIKKMVKEVLNPQNRPYMIYTPSYATLLDYKKEPSIDSNNCKVNQWADVPEKAEVIIFDEIGMLDKGGHNLLYQCFLAGKEIIAYGDFNQLQPISSDKLNQTNYLNLIFGNNQHTMENNYRNDFSRLFYKSLYTNDLNIIPKFSGCGVYRENKHRLQVVKAYNTENYWEAEVILCYSNKTRRKYNKLMCERLGIQSKCDIGAKLVLKSNDIGRLEKSPSNMLINSTEGEMYDIWNNKLMCEIYSKSPSNMLINPIEGEMYDIWNNFPFEVVNNSNYNIDPDEVIIKNEMGIYIISKTLINKHFDYFYARTIHSIQGQTIKSYCIPEDDLKEHLMSIEGLAYVIVSRLQNPVIFPEHDF